VVISDDDTSNTLQDAKRFSHGRLTIVQLGLNIFERLGSEGDERGARINDDPRGFDNLAHDLLRLAYSNGSLLVTAGLDEGRYNFVVYGV